MAELDGAGQTRLALGDRVFLHGNRSGQPGIVIRLRGGRATVLWSDPDYIGTCPHLALELAANSIAKRAMQ